MAIAKATVAPSVATSRWTNAPTPRADGRGGGPRRPSRAAPCTPVSSATTTRVVIVCATARRSCSVRSALRVRIRQVDTDGTSSAFHDRLGARRRARSSWSGAGRLALRQAGPRPSFEGEMRPGPVGPGSARDQRQGPDRGDSTAAYHAGIPGLQGDEQAATRPLHPSAVARLRLAQCYCAVCHGDEDTATGWWPQAVQTSGRIRSRMARAGRAAQLSTSSTALSEHGTRMPHFRRCSGNAESIVRYRSSPHGRGRTELLQPPVLSAAAWGRWASLDEALNVCPMTAGSARERKTITQSGELRRRTTPATEGGRRAPAGSRPERGAPAYGWRPPRRQRGRGSGRCRGGSSARGRAS